MILLLQDSFDLTFYSILFYSILFKYDILLGLHLKSIMGELRIRHSTGFVPSLRRWLSWFRLEHLSRNRGRWENARCLSASLCKTGRLSWHLCRERPDTMQANALTQEQAHTHTHTQTDSPAHILGKCVCVCVCVCVYLRSLKRGRQNVSVIKNTYCCCGIFGGCVP